jgi:predicted nucleic acid-binding protein
LAYLIDTNIAIHLRDRDVEVIERVAALDDAVVMSVVTRVELEGGLHTNPALTAIRRARLQALLDTIPALPFDKDAAEAYRRILEATGYSRRKVLDRMIAAQALVCRAKLVTLNADDFKDVPDLEIVAW